MPIERLKPTFSLDEERLRALEQIVPEAVSEGRINWEVLRELLGERVEDEALGAEHFGLFWPGKREARRLAARPSKGTLVPMLGEGVSEETTENIFIEGDNLEVLKLLQKSYSGRIKMIYIDPPYNTGQDFIYKDSYTQPLEEYLKDTQQIDEEGNVLTTNTKADGRFHTKWLNMMYPRLKLARNLLKEDGIIFVSIDDNEVHNLRQIMDEIFGPENFIDTIIWKKRYGGGAKEKYLVSLHEYVLFYTKNYEALDSIFIPTDPESIERYYKFRDENYEIRGPFRTHPLEATKSVGVRKNLIYPIPAPDGTEILPERQWWWDRERAMTALEKKELHFVKNRDGKWSVHTKQYLKDEEGKQRETKAFSIIDNAFTQLGTAEIAEVFGDSKIFPFPKPTKLIKSLVQIANASAGDIVLDLFAGSGTTAHALMDMNVTDGNERKYICIQFPEKIDKEKDAYKAGYTTIAEITKERIRRVSRKIKNELKGQLSLDNQKFDLGCKVFKLDRSSFQAWQDYRGDDIRQLEILFASHETPFIEGWKEQDVLIELLLIEGFPLNSKIAPDDTFTANSVVQIESDFSAHRLFICVEPSINAKTIQRIAELPHEDIFICLDSALTDACKVRLADVGNVRTI
ncbi:MAG TPA: site-specific DNA-methyltransferase [Pyrinomonadaceae bacterium]|jgi:adenine-specific DNA-methyltransferase